MRELKWTSLFAPPRDADPINQCTDSSNTSVEKSDRSLLFFIFKYVFLLQYSIIASVFLVLWKHFVTSEVAKKLQNANFPSLY